MIELGEFAREGRLADHLGEYYRPYGTIDGLAIAYDEALVQEAGRMATFMAPSEWRGTLEFSQIVASLLAGVGYRRERGEGLEAEPYREEVKALDRWWEARARRIGMAKTSPIVIHVSLPPPYGFRPYPDFRHDLSARWMRRPAEAQPYRALYRPSSRSVLHSAEAGGCIAPGLSGRGYGTVGGFLCDSFDLNLYALTAAHVCDATDGFTAPTLLPSAPGPVREAARIALWSTRGLLLPRLRPQDCPFLSESAATQIPRGYCTVQAASSGTGLDAALHRVSLPHERLSTVEITPIAALSQGLPLTFAGARSGLQSVKICAWSIWHSYERRDGADVCIDDCLQIRLSERPYVRTTLSQGGDSGAWLLARGVDQTHWVGMLTGGDSDRAGIVPALRIVDHFSSTLGLPLTAAI